MSASQTQLICSEGLSSVLQCAFCFEPPKRAMMAPCGHTFCDHCICEWLNTCHSCPTCKQKCFASDLHRNLMVEAIVDSMATAIEKSNVNLIESVFCPKDSTTDSSQSPAENLFTIQNTFAKHLKQSYKDFSDHERYLEVEYRKACNICSSDDTESHLIKLSHLRFRYENAKSILNQDLDEFLSQHCTKPSLLPSNITIIVRRKLSQVPHGNENDNVIEPLAFPDIYFNMRIFSTSIAFDVIEFVQDQINGNNNNRNQKKNNIKKNIAPMNLNGLMISLRSRDNQVHDKTVLDENILPIQIPMNSKIPLFKYARNDLNRIDSSFSDIILIEYNVELQDEVKEDCFASQFKQGLKNTTDYYRCETCDLNWVCDECSRNCHLGHELTSYLMQHSPTWACCYCSKKKRVALTLCKLCS